MSYGTLQPYFSFYRFPSGRRSYALYRVAERARERGLTDIAEAAETVIEQCQQTADMQATWNRSRSTPQGRRLEAARLDVLLDRLLGGLASQLASTVHAFGDEELGKRAAALQSQIFPEGALAITRLSYENELESAEVIHRRLLGPFASDAAALGIGPFIDRLGELIPQYREALGQETQRDVTFDQIREARSNDQEAMLRVIVMILGRYPGADQADREVRVHLLAPFMDQQRRLREGFTNRRPAGDIDPDTGEEEPVSAEDEDLDGSGEVDPIDPLSIS